ncbi:MAG: hypothetical protein ACYS5V_17820 [Planctomycetota bacterium]
MCLGFFVVGSVSGPLLLGWAGQSPAARLVYRIWPNFWYFFAIDSLMQEKPIPLYYVGLTAAYAACQIVAILAIGMALFQRRELEVATGGGPLGVSLLAGLGRIWAVLGMFTGATIVANLHSPLRVAAGNGVIALGVLAWFYWGWFARGRKWTWYVTLAAGAVNVVSGAVWVVQLVGWGGPRPWLRALPVCAGIGVSLVVLLVLVLPVTRHHFSFAGKKRRSGFLAASN